MSIYLGGGKEYSDMQGPCPSGFHVPLKSEWDNLISYGTTLGAFSSNNFCTYLHIPKNGERARTNASVTNTTYGYYWSSSKNDNGERYFLFFNDGQYLETSSDWGTYGMNIRPFKDTSVIPDSNWTVEFQGTGTAGIYHDSTNGLISISSDGINRITISDKNCGATEVYNNGTSITQLNGGCFYQRGNNYGFALSGSLTTSTTRVDATGYGPGNYYSSSTFILTSSSPYNWDTSNNGNLWGGVSQGSGTKPGIKEIYLGEGKTIVLSDMQGPCPDGFHIPTKDEFQGVYNIVGTLGIGQIDGWNKYLKMPLAYSINTNGTLYGQGCGYYWSCTHKGTNTYYVYVTSFGSGYFYLNLEARTGFGNSIRPFKNSFVAPTSSWTVLYGTLGSAGIFWNQTDGLISITSDGSTGYTLADKNLGATTVYNDGDGLTESNCGKWYQRGNNYGFTWGVAPTDTTTTQVNASTYGPGNYYESSTFIKQAVWDTSDNANLWGGVSQGSSTIVKPGIKAVYVGGPREVILSDMQGPAPDGFHVPLSTEWQGLNTIMSGLGLTTGPSWKINLHMPFAGCRLLDTAAPVNLNSYGYYWSSSPYGSSAPTNARNLYLYSKVLANDNSPRPQGNSVRCFKDSFEVPTSSWTVVVGTLGGAGIFWDQSEGLISITSDGTTGYTIQDKNLGATTVYNDGDALTQANMGNMYQWGNNYGFPSTGSVTTSSTRVDASSYGPGNYYTDSTFITTSSSPYNRDSSNNDNLRGGVSQGTSTKTVYNKIRPKEE